MVWPFKHKLLSRVPSIVSFFLQNEILFFFSCVYNSSLTFQAVAVSYSCNTRNLPFE